MSLLLTFVELDRLYESQNTEWVFIGTATVPHWSTYSGRTFTIEDPIVVNGKSEADALNHVKYVIRNRNNLPNYVPLVLSNHVICKKSELEVSSNDVCIVCGTALSDGGMCPICTDGEEDY
jgi:hypothetical protein